MCVRVYSDVYLGVGERSSTRSQMESKEPWSLIVPGDGHHLYWVAPWRLTGDFCSGMLWEERLVLQHGNQDSCAQELSFHWQQQYLLHCPFTELSLTLVLRALMHRGSSHPLTSVFLHIRLDIFYSPGEIPSSLPPHVPQSSSSPWTLKLNAETLGIIPLTGTFFWKQKRKFSNILFFFLLLANCRSGGSYLELIS